MNVVSLLKKEKMEMGENAICHEPVVIGNKARFYMMRAPGLGYLHQTKIRGESRERL